MTIKIELYLDVEEGSEEELAGLLSDGKLSKTIGNYAANVAVGNIDGKTFKVVAEGGFAHAHNPEGGVCSTCLSLSTRKVFRKYKDA